MNVAVVLFTSDLRLHDQPVLGAALRRAEQVVPLFVRDRGVTEAGFDAPNRRAFLADCLAGLDAGLRERGGRLVIRTGDVVDEVCRVVAQCGAREVHVAGGVTHYASRREDRLRTALGNVRCALHVHDAVVTAVTPGRVTPAGRDHFAVFTPYLRKWEAAGVRDVAPAPRSVRVPDAVGSDPLPTRRAVTGTSPALAKGGEPEGRGRLPAWLADGVEAYGERQDDLAGDATSRLSPHLHFGTLSAAELVHLARRRGGPGAAAFVRQLAWRDFHYQVLAARPTASWTDYRTRGDHWRTDEREIAAWQEGLTGYPVVDAAMRQLRHEGWMHNRGRLLTASFLAKTLYVDWRVGARHFLDLLVDGDVANNQLNWQWVAGTGTDTRPNRLLNPLAQARRFDPRGDYVRRWVPELAGLAGAAVHQPWTVPGPERARIDYPDPVVDLAEGRARFERARGLN
ncbi:deoxyribodipyrimidine photolyase [Streptomyces agglomeratus]|uniref:Deoxyribodipyrimidine photolyase n=1 Tax=Streptomyces agglomeratus TaxID=285458 RepID=A0A1E5PDX6_9ACTN|nr:deoxyribodipyrimidine photo-lyase [Streptomyces agglomeratus]OEJ27733.1 deoxyribodipyrimidine photolyase [Streptomyces agglomeratus]OEJ38207.1 deoxyribodipyrimidine photolyase [Streptomyces agglomeratus]OEJ47409.1 deoxyribodipyrimidine photolyase [Streptomyces agglomeratus]OEJ50734.1 deoxyribodipyrimidine photolyase [Streptomyces agglomeratus]OEJ58096.1 deoxyribodipyrimidine photolyase [Streptomyces agglomeratus]